MKTHDEKIKNVLTRGVDKIYPTKEELEKVLKSGKKIRLYQGFDPTGIKLHIGHLAGLMKLRQFQELGHEVIFLIGDGTGQAGDPSGKSRTRDKFLSLSDLKENAKDYVLQAGKVVKFEGENAAKIMYNSAWLNKLTLTEILDIAGNFTLQQLEERDMFVERKKKNEPISMREFMYPLLQGYDSVAMNVDLEIGGSDQTFNMLTGRTLVKNILNKEKFVLTIPLIADKNGVKIGKTEGNVIALTSAAKDFFAMIMTLPDEVIVQCFESCTELPMTQVDEIKDAIKNGENPMKFKKLLAHTLTAMLNSEEEAEDAKREFENVVQNKELPQEIPTAKLKETDEMPFIDFLVQYNLVKSKSEAKRLVEQGAVEVDGNKIEDPKMIFIPQNNSIIKAGKRNYLKVIVNN